LNLERDEALHNASSNHFKHKDSIPTLDFTNLQIPPEIRQKQIAAANLKITKNEE
jgi:hypothetical protein